MSTLIVYATKYGTTEKVVKALTERILGEVESYNLKDSQHISISKYDKVIIGGSIYAGKVRKEVNQFCINNHEILKEKKLGLFICGMLEREAEAELKSSYSSELMSHAIAKEFFGGEFQFKKMKLMEKFIVKMVAKAEKTSPPLDTSKDISTISYQTINRFAELMNQA